MTETSRPLVELYGKAPGQPWGSVEVNELLRALDERIRELQVLKGGLEAAYATASDVALNRINSVLTPAIAQVNQTLANTQALYDQIAADGATIAQSVLDQSQQQVAEVLAGAIEATQAATDAAAAAQVVADGSYTDEQVDTADEATRLYARRRVHAYTLT